MIPLVTIKDAFEFVRNGLSIKQSENSVGFPITRIETIWNSTIDINRFGYADIKDVEKYKNNLLNDGDILMSHINSPKHLGKSAIYEGNPKQLIHGMNLLNLRPNRNISLPKYLYFYLNSDNFKNQIKKISNQSVNQASFSSGNLKKLKIPLPSLPEQQKIASILDAADSLRQKDQQLIEKYTALSQSLFLEMFGDPKVNPNNWPLTALGKIIEEGPQNGLYKPSGDYGTGTPIIRIDSFHNSVVELSKLKRVRVSEGELSKFEIFEGDFVLNRVNSPSHLGKCGLVSKVKERMVFESNMMRIKFNKSMVNNTFMLSILSSKYLKHQILNSSKDAVNQSSINQKDVNSFEIPLPPIELQNQFAERIQLIEAQKQQAQASLEKSEALFNSLLQRAFKGELTV